MSMIHGVSFDLWTEINVTPISTVPTPILYFPVKCSGFTLISQNSEGATNRQTQNEDQMD